MGFQQEARNEGRHSVNVVMNSNVNWRNLEALSPDLNLMDTAYNETGTLIQSPATFTKDAGALHSQTSLKQVTLPSLNKVDHAATCQFSPPLKVSSSKLDGVQQEHQTRTERSSMFIQIKGSLNRDNRSRTLLLNHGLPITERRGGQQVRNMILSLQSRASKSTIGNKFQATHHHNATAAGLSAVNGSSPLEKTSLSRSPLTNFSLALQEAKAGAQM